MRRVGLIPARSGSKRIPKKNVINLAGHPLIAYAIASAFESELFDEVLLSTDCEETADIGRHYGARVDFLRPKSISSDTSPDIEWVNLVINDWLRLEDFDLFAILRPTNPLRSAKSIIKAFSAFEERDDLHSLRGVRRVKEHPSKMWRMTESRMIEPFLPSINQTSKVEAHSTPMQSLEQIYIQDASIEICKVWVARKLNSLTGHRVLGFEMPGFEGFDINYSIDVDLLDYLLSKGEIELPKVTQVPFWIRK